MDEILNMTALELSAAIKKGDVTCREAAQAALDAVRARDGQLNAFTCVTQQQALERAAALEKTGGGGPLFGVPGAVKDNICTRGIPTTCASRILEHYVPPYNAGVIDRLDEAGTVLLGKLNMDEFAMGSTSETSCFGPVKNPWDLSRVPGGSSGGAAAAVAAGEVWFALGTDTGGSVRQPAAWCGVTGIKPTYGTVSRYGLVAYASSFDQVGAICRDAADCAAVLDAIQGHDPRDSTGLPGEYGGLLAGLNGDARGMKIGMPVQWFGDELDERVRRRVMDAVRALRDAGAQVETCCLPAADYALAAYYVIACAEASSNLARYDGIRYGKRCVEYTNLEELYLHSRSEGFGAEAKRRILLGTFVLSEGHYNAYYTKALTAKERVKQNFRELFFDYDLLLSPVTAGFAPELGRSLEHPARMYEADSYTVCANLAGFPALSMPCGHDECGLPVGVQLIGPAFGEQKLLNAAHAVQRETDWHRRRPPCFGTGGEGV